MCAYIIQFVNLRNKKHKNRMNEKRTLEKCRKIMLMFEGSKPVNSNPNMKLRKSIKSPSAGSRSGSASSLSLSLKSSKLNKSTVYNRQSRYDKIMKLKTKPMKMKKNEAKSSYLNSSQKSLFSCLSQESRSKSKKKENRLEKIMKLKVTKPKADSTLKNYEPVKMNKSLVRSRKENEDSNSILEIKECKQKMRKQTKQIEKQDRLWKVFEREREMRLRQKQRNQKLCYDRERSLEKRFEILVQKQLKRMESQKQVEDRRGLGFSPYLFPSY